MAITLSYMERQFTHEKQEAKDRRQAEIIAIESGGKCEKCYYTKPHGLSLWCQRKAKLINKFSICSMYKDKNEQA